MNFKQEERDAYEDRLKWFMIEDSALKEGKEEGRQEEKLQIAIALKAKGVAISIISESTGLSIDEIKKLNKYQ